MANNEKKKKLQSKIEGRLVFSEFISELIASFAGGS
jgi:hypothetical protein